MSVILALGIAVVLSAVVVGTRPTSSPTKTASSPTEAASDPTEEAAAADHTGYRDFSFSANNVKNPTGDNNQSKLWFNDGLWWGILFDRTTGKSRIHRYNWDTRSWIDTGTDVDARNFPKADALWDGTHLYVVSAGPDSSVSAQSARLMRYSYDAVADKYSLDSGFPVPTTSGGVKQIVLEKDTTGRLWMTYARDGQVYVSHSLGDDLSWAEPSVLPVAGAAGLGREDISAMVAFDSQIGLMWSNRDEGAFYFAVHGDGDDPDDWRASTALKASKELQSDLPEPNFASAHINLKADSSGRVYAAVETSLDESRSGDPETPLTALLVRDEAGSWSSHVFGREGDQHARPIVLIDDEHRELYMFATSPCCQGGSIYYKKTSLDAISFPEGKGTPFVQSATDTNISDATSTKQNLDGETRLLVLASDRTSGYYLHNALDVDGS